MSPPPDAETFGKALFRLRRDRQLSGHLLAQRAGMSQAKISRLENGAVAAPADVRKLARALDLSVEEERRLAELALQVHELLAGRPARSDVVARQRFVAELEAATDEFRIFQPAVVVGLLQTSDYARAVMTSFRAELGAGGTVAPTADVATAVAARMERQRILDDHGKHFHIVMTESVLRNRVCRPTHMVAQVERLREVAAQSNVTLRIVSCDAELIIAPYHGFELMDDRCVSIDLFNTSLMSGHRGTVDSYRRVYDALERSARADVARLLDRYARRYAEIAISEMGLAVDQD